MSLIINKKKFLTRPQAPEVGQRRLVTAASNTVTFTFVNTPAAGSLLLFFYTNNGSQEALSTSPSGYNVLYAPTPGPDGPKSHTGYVIADGTTNSFTFTTPTGSNASCYGFEIISWSAVTFLGFNFQASTTGTWCTASSNSIPAKSLVIGFMATGNTFSALNTSLTPNYIINLSNNRSGSAERFFDSAVSGGANADPDCRFGWTTDRQVRSSLIRITL